MGKPNDVNDENIEELEDGQPESSTGEESSGGSSSGDVKTVTPKNQEQSKVVPYERFEEVNRKNREFEEAIAEHKDKFVRDPITGKLKFRLTEEKPKPKDEDDLTDEDLLVFDETQMKVLQKLANRIQKQVFGTLSAKETYQTEFNKSWSEATKKFPALLDQNSELYKEANRILFEEHAQKLPSGQWFVPNPKSHYDAAVKAAWILKERAEEQQKTKEENLKMKTQNSFVSKGSKKEAPDSGKKKRGDDFESLSLEEQEALIQEEYEEATKDQE